EELHNESFGDSMTRDVARAQEFQFTRFNFIFFLNFNSINTELSNLKSTQKFTTQEELRNESFGDSMTRDVARAQGFQFTRFNFIFFLNFNSTNTELSNLKSTQ
ncbi:hypothetical protein HAX54_014546, partial [Datura stramonium]|nr:hypothetical protein [Datura stramonium]